MRQLYIFLLLNLCCFSYAMDDAALLRSLENIPVKKGRKKKRSRNAKTRSKIETLPYISLKALTQKYGYQTACDLKQLSQLNFAISGDYLQALSFERKERLLPAFSDPKLSHPIHIAQIAKNDFLPEELVDLLGRYIAHELYKSLMHYKYMQPERCVPLDNATCLSYSPHKKEIAFTNTLSAPSTIYRWNQDLASQPTVFYDTPHAITKLRYHPTHEDEFIDLTQSPESNASLLTLCHPKTRKKDLQKRYGHYHVKDFIVSPSNPNQLILCPKNKKKKPLAFFDLEHECFVKNKEDGLVIRPEVDRIVQDPHCPNRVAILSPMHLIIKDLKTKKTLYQMKLNKHNGVCAFDPYHPNTIAYASGNKIRLVNFVTSKHFAQLKHKTHIKDFAFDPHTPYGLTCTQENGKTMQWQQEEIIPQEAITFDAMIKWLDNPTLENGIEKEALKEALGIKEKEVQEEQKKDFYSVRPELVEG